MIILGIGVDGIRDRRGQKPQPLFLLLVVVLLLLSRRQPGGGGGGGRDGALRHGVWVFAAAFKYNEKFGMYTVRSTKPTKK